MLQDVDTVDDIGQRFGFLLRSVVAFDPTSSAELHASRAHRRSGRPSSYWVTVLTGTFYEHDGSERRAKAFGLTAYGDDEAIEKANKRLEKWLAQGYVFDAKQWQWRKPELEQSTAGDRAARAPS